jgi:histidyl-tRNA synthetase
MSQTLQAVRGMNDILPADAALGAVRGPSVRDWLRATATADPHAHGRADAAVRAAIGEVTDIVEKEMYSFVDALNGESLTLRPEGTASCVRAVLEHNLLYDGRQAPLVHGPDVPPRAAAEGPLPPVPPGRRRGLGFAGPDVDAEQI